MENRTATKPVFESRLAHDTRNKLALLYFEKNAKNLMRHTGWPKKSKPPPICQKIALKIANEIRFLRKVKV